MFCNNKAINLAALNVLLAHTDEHNLVNAVYNAYVDINLNKKEYEDTLDQEVLEIVKTVKTISNDIYEKGIKTPTEAQRYFSMSNIDPELKEYVTNSIEHLSDKMIEEYTNYFGLSANIVAMEDSYNKLAKMWDTFSDSSLSEIGKRKSDFLSSADVFYKNITKFREETVKTKDFVIDPMNDKMSFGIEQLEEDVVKSDKNTLFTGTWFDNITGGLKAESLYIISAISGGGKSLFMQNMAEEISCHMKRDDMTIPTGTVPVLLYVNLEISTRQLIERSIAFHKGDRDYIFYGDSRRPPETIEEREADKGGMRKRLTEMYKKSGVQIPIIYHTENSTKRTYSIADLKNTILRYQQKGFTIVGVFTDYLDKFKWNQDESPSERERDEPITLKAYEHKDLATDFRIPVVTAAQINRAGESIIKEELSKAAYKDIVKKFNSSFIGKAQTLTNVPEQFYFVHKYTVSHVDRDNEYFALVVDKDRDHKAKVLDKDGNRVIRSKGNTKGEDARPYYIVKIPNDDGVSSFRIGNDFSYSISEFEEDYYEELAEDTISDPVSDKE